jgi:hypothetical protein
MSRAESQCFCFGFHNRQQGNRLPQVWKVTKHLTVAPVRIFDFSEGVAEGESLAVGMAWGAG